MPSIDNLQHFFNDFYQATKGTQLEQFQACIPTALAQRFQYYRHGLLKEWLQTLSQLPTLPAENIDWRDTIAVSSKQPLSPQEKERLTKQLKTFCPWRKGPYAIHGINIDTEWRSDWKWDRIKNAISSLHDRTVLDIGCGNGYHCWRMYGDGARMVVGVDPSQLFWMQFEVIKHFLGRHPVFFLPLGIEYLPRRCRQFDTIFSMGVFYHRKSPFEHLQQLRRLIREGGELVLETLVIEGQANDVLVPADRYACMANVWFIPSTAAMQNWLARAGFSNIRLIDVNQTSRQEQRSTEWMPFQSLPDFLDPTNPEKTREGYPAPRRAVFAARS